MTSIQSTKEETEQNPMRAAHEAPRCEHIRTNGTRCAAPALRGLRHCHFHNQLPVLFETRTIEFIEDATSLQLAIMQVIRLIVQDAIQPKRCTALLYALQLAFMNLKNFMAEQAKEEGETPTILDEERRAKVRAELTQLLTALAAERERGLTA